MQKVPLGASAWQFRWLAAAVLFALTFPRIAQPGMFIDGVAYAVVARNMALGQGTFWQPSVSDTVYATFFEQPPLGMALQSLAFRLFGDHLFVERLFSMVVFALTGLLIAAIWRRLLPPSYDWLPLFFWALPSVVTWAAINNMLENTQVLFTTAAVFCVLSAVRSRPPAAFAWTCGAASCVVAAFLTKGPVGLFPLVVPCLLLVIPELRGQIRKVVMIWIAMMGLVVTAGAALWSMDAARYSLSQFGRTHLLPTLEGSRGVGNRSWDIARHLTLGIWLRMTAAVLLLWIVRRRAAKTGSYKPAAALFFLVGLSASLPILVSPVLAGHYFVPSVPWFALAAGALAVPAIQTMPSPAGRGRLVPLGIAGGLVLTCAVVLVAHGPMEPRDKSVIAGLDAIRSAAPVKATVGTCANGAGEIGFHGYLQRFFRISIDPSDSPVGGWFIVLRAGCPPPAGCVRKAGDATVQLYRCDARAAG